MKDKNPKKKPDKSEKAKKDVGNKDSGAGSSSDEGGFLSRLFGSKKSKDKVNARGEYETASLDRATSRKGKIRRHTVGGSGIAGDIMRAEEEVKLKQRDALFDHLAQRYPQHSNTIQGYHQRVPDPAMEVRPSSVQMQRRMVAQDQRQHYGYEEEDDGIMSEAETEATGNFRRGGFVRSSLPMRSPRGERPPALVFLVFNGATKRALLPPELAHLDTIKALFARSFGDQLNMKMLENPRKKIFVMDPNSNYYRPLEDVRDIRDRCVLKLHDLDSKDTLQTKPVYYGNRNYEDPSYYSEPEYDSGVSHMRRPPTKSPTYHGYPPQQVPGQSRTLPPPSEYMSHDEIQRMFLQQQVVAGRPPGRGPTPTGQWEGQRGRTTPTSQPYGPPQRPPPSPGPHQGYPPQPSRQMAAQSLPTTPIMQRDPRTMNYNNAYQSGTRSGNVTPTPSNDPGTRMQMAKMEAQLANLTALVHNVVSRPGSAAGSLTGSHNSGSASSISGGSTSTPQPEISSEVQDSIRGLQAKAKELKTECRNLRRIQEAQADNIRDTIREAFEKIKDAMTGVPGASGHPLRARRSRADVHCDTFKQDCKRVENELSDLESSVEELRSDVINRRCRVNMADVESMALALSHISKALGELKGGFPVLQEELKTVMTAEMEVVVKEEKYLKDEPERLESALKKCKKLTGTLFTLKRLASVQEHRTPVVPQLMTMTVGEDEKKALFENIQHMIPNHDARMLSIEASENSRERKKKLVTSHEVRKFEKSLELASRALREKREKEVEEEDARKKLEGDSGIMNDMSNTSDPMQPERDGSETDTMKRRKALRELSPEKETSIDDDLEKPQSSSHAPPLAPPSLAQSQQSAFKRVIPGGGYIRPATLKLPARGPLAGSYQVASQVAVQSVTEKQQIAVTQVAHSHTLPREQNSKSHLNRTNQSQIRTNSRQKVLGPHMMTYL
ncbi:coiled-coil domain-containing protein AGAP005037 isoform X2 [Lingula anatina]|uniref:Coiled-coil domain-containing protein AGAP005037 isoform X2 n=1 Tax=Lingula anatina TaxID=7574 RepID=A0A1S3H3P3_LINAN|nr:coiled-coil domain-containing protein AGAP005037 isoform X2 [Lingula anatina]|eukprot:XP_013380086.1 coiled-coil domain-containing protein AGAP005037 isoform X2 [Lingula anatina]